MTKFTDEEKLACLEREIKYRKRVYTRLVANNKMSPQLAEREIALMVEIAADYEARIPRLFPPVRQREDMSEWDKADMDEWLGDKA